MPEDCPVIPKKLQDAGYRFIRILPRSKDPIDKLYTTTRNYIAEEPQIALWINHYQNFELPSRDETGTKVHFEGYGNYGVLGTETLVAIDLDRQDIIDLALIHPLLKTAFSAQSGSGKGLHIWVKTHGARTTRMTDMETGENVGHIKAKGGYVVGPGCYHPSGGRYRIINDGGIPEISFEELLNHFEKYIEKKEPLVEKETRHTKFHSDHDDIDIPIERILSPLKPKRSGSEIKGIHPIHGSKSEQNLSINTRKNVWSCYRCNSGGGPALAIAVAHGLINCSEAKPGALKGEIYKQVLEIAEEYYGWTRKIKTAPQKPKILPEIRDDINFDIDILKKPDINSDTLPEELPDVDVTLIDALPRIGKSHRSEIWAINAQTANIIANTHSVIDQHLRIFRENRKAGQTAVHLEGRNRCCLHGDERRSCDRCDYYPYTSDPADRGHFLAYVDEILHKKEILTKHDVVGEEYCPYFFLKEAAKIADYVYTVPENLEEITGEQHQPRHLTVIDEDTCFASFFPQSVDLAEFERGSTRNNIKNIVEVKWKGIQKWKDYIVNGKKRPKGKKTILRMIEILEQMREVLRIKDDVVFSPSEVLHEMSLIDFDIPEPEDITRPELIKLIERWEITDSFSPFAKALLYPYEDKMLMWQGHNPMKLRLIADEQKRIYDPPNTKMVLIGSTRAEIFLNTLERKWQVVRINNFKYSKNFVFVVIKEETGKHRRTYQEIIELLLKKISQTNDNTRYPLLTLVGTTMDQHKLINELGGIAKGSSDENITGQRWNYVSGCINIFYQNSVISRGVDIPFYKVLVMYSSDFANPYWTAKKEVATENEDNDEIENINGIIDAINMDETTNSVLRVTPVPGQMDTTPRVVVIGERDYWKLKSPVVEEAMVVNVEADQIIDHFESIFGITGKLEILPSKADDGINEDGKFSVHNYIDTIYDEPLVIRGTDVDIKGRYLADLLSEPESPHERWRMKTTPMQIAKTETEITSFLMKLHDGGKVATLGKIVDMVTKSHKNKMDSAVIIGIVTNMVRSNKVRMRSGEGTHGLKAKIELPTIVTAKPIPDIYLK